jgi:hypothetical protein
VDLLKFKDQIGSERYVEAELISTVRVTRDMAERTGRPSRVTAVVRMDNNETIELEGPPAEYFLKILDVCARKD